MTYFINLHETSVIGHIIYYTHYCSTKLSKINSSFFQTQHSTHAQLKAVQLSSSGGDGGGSSFEVLESGVSERGSDVVVTHVLLGTQLVEGIHLDQAIHSVVHLINQGLLLGGQRTLGLLGGGHCLVSLHRQREDLVQQTRAVLLVRRHEDALGQLLADATGRGDQLRGLRGPLEGFPVGKVMLFITRPIPGMGKFSEQALHGQLEDGIDALDVSVLTVVPQRGIAQVQGAEGVSITAGQLLLEFQTTTQVGGHCEVGGKAAQLTLIVVQQVGLGTRAGEDGSVGVGPGGPGSQSRRW